MSIEVLPSVTVEVEGWPPERREFDIPEPHVILGGAELGIDAGTANIRRSCAASERGRELARLCPSTRHSPGRGETLRDITPDLREDLGAPRCDSGAAN